MLGPPECLCVQAGVNLVFLVCQAAWVPETRPQPSGQAGAVTRYGAISHRPIGEAANMCVPYHIFPLNLCQLCRPSPTPLPGLWLHHSCRFNIAIERVDERREAALRNSTEFYVAIPRRE